MKFLVALLLAMSVSFSAFAAVGGKHDCCPAMDCGFAQCADMGCAPSATPLAPPVSLAVPQWQTVQEQSAEPIVTIPSRHEEIWTPPD